MAVSGRGCLDSSRRFEFDLNQMNQERRRNTTLCQFNDETVDSSIEELVGQDQL